MQGMMGEQMGSMSSEGERIRCGYHWNHPGYRLRLTLQFCMKRQMKRQKTCCIHFTKYICISKSFRIQYACTQAHWVLHKETVEKSLQQCNWRERAPKPKHLTYYYQSQIWDSCWLIIPYFRQVVLEPRVSPEHTWKYVDTVSFCKNLNQRSLTPRWPLTPHLLRSYVWLYPRIIVSKSHENMWIQWPFLQKLEAKVIDP